jgi:hypothetical protein
MGSRALRRDYSRRRSVAPLLLGLTIYLVWPAHALARAVVRFVHAVPGVGTATVELTSGSDTTKAGSIRFAQSTAWHSLRSGRFLWRLNGSNGTTLASGTATIGDGAFTAVVLAKGQGAVLGIYRDRPGVPGKSLVRVIHAAPELGSPSLKFDSKVVAPQLNFAAATPYLSVNPGEHSFAAMSSNSSAPFLQGTVKLASDVAYTEIVVGSRGQRVRVVTVTDRGAPLTRPAASTQARVAPSSHPSAGKSGWVMVARGDSLWAIARRRLGDGASNAEVSRLVIAVWNANARRIGTSDPNLIFPGQLLHIPATR